MLMKIPTGVFTLGIEILSEVSGGDTLDILEKIIDSGKKIDISTLKVTVEPLHH